MEESTRPFILHEVANDINEVSNRKETLTGSIVVAQDSSVKMDVATNRSPEDTVVGNAQDNREQGIKLSRGKMDEYEKFSLECDAMIKGLEDVEGYATESWGCAVDVNNPTGFYPQESTSALKDQDFNDFINEEETTNKENGILSSVQEQTIGMCQTGIGTNVNDRINKGENNKNVSDVLVEECVLDPYVTPTDPRRQPNNATSYRRDLEENSDTQESVDEAALLSHSLVFDMILSESHEKETQKFSNDGGMNIRVENVVGQAFDCFPDIKNNESANDSIILDDEDDDCILVIDEEADDLIPYAEINSPEASPEEMVPTLSPVEMTEGPPQFEIISEASSVEFVPALPPAEASPVESVPVLPPVETSPVKSVPAQALEEVDPEIEPPPVEMVSELPSAKIESVTSWNNSSDRINRTKNLPPPAIETLGRRVRRNSASLDSSQVSVASSSSAHSSIKPCSVVLIRCSHSPSRCSLTSTTQLSAEDEIPSGHERKVQTNENATYNLHSEAGVKVESNESPAPALAKESQMNDSVSPTDSLEVSDEPVQVKPSCSVEEPRGRQRGRKRQSNVQSHHVIKKEKVDELEPETRSTASDHEHFPVNDRVNIKISENLKDKEISNMSLKELTKFIEGESKKPNPNFERLSEAMTRTYENRKIRIYEKPHVELYEIRDCPGLAHYQMVSSYFKVFTSIPPALS